MSQAIASPPLLSAGGSPGGRLLRAGIAALLAAGVALGLLWIMQYLIAIADRTLDEDPAPVVLDFVRVQPEQVAQQQDRKPRKPPPPKKPPPEPPKPKLDDIKPSTDKIAISAVPVETEISLSGAGFNMGAVAEGDFLPLNKVAPVYPQRALARGIEGFCTVTYTVTERGTTRDISVVDGECSNRLFQRASIEAARKFKYKPRVRGGKAVATSGVRNRFEFNLETQGR